MKGRGRNQTRIAVDIGGTFTDIIVQTREGEYVVRKVASSPDDYSSAIVTGIKGALEDAGLDTGDVEQLIHSTTVATNAILQRCGAKTALITTRGFRDVLELGRIRLPVLYNLQWEKPRPLVERRYRVEVDERIGADGRILRPLDEPQARERMGWLREEGIESLAICLLHAYRNPVHERRLKEIAEEELPGVHVSLSSDILPEIMEYERTSTTVANAYVQPSVNVYLEILQKRLRMAGLSCPVFIMQSNGGMLTLKDILERPVLTLESGPAAGVVAAASLAERIGARNVITFDMGGTTAKASVIENGQIIRTSEFEIGGDLSASSRLIKGSGQLIRIPAIDLVEVGAGGGSVAWLDRGGGLHVGPRSVGSRPGPACYGLGNDEPTVTDANVVLGYLNANYIVGGTVRIDGSRSWQAIESRIASRMGLSIERAAHGIHTLANDNMTRAVRAVTIERGRDPSNFVMIVFGGNGPLHGPAIARMMGIRRVLVPPFPGLFSSLGLLMARVERDFIRSGLRRLDGSVAGEVKREIAELKDKARAWFIDHGYTDAQIQLQTFLHLRYQGQFDTIRIPYNGRFDVQEVRAAFDHEHERLYGYAAPEDPVEIVSVSVSGQVAVANEPAWPRVTRAESVSQRDEDRGARRAYFGEDVGWYDTPVLTNRGQLQGKEIRGPAIIEEYDATTVVPPGATAALDKWGNIVIDL